MSQHVHYANWWSKLLFKKSFENQFYIPLPATRIEMIIMHAIERFKFDLDHSQTKIDRPIFIVGLPRSGTTLLYNLLCAHENSAYVTNSINAFPTAICTIEWLRKKLNLDIRGERFLADSVETDFGSPSEPIMFWGKWFGRDVESLYWEEKRIKDISAEKIDEIFSDIRKILFSFAPNGKRFICKYPVLQTELRLIQDIFPDAHFIHIVRDARTTANSMVKLHEISNQQIQKIKHPKIKYIVPYPRVKNLQKYINEFGATDVRCTAHVWQDAIETVHECAKDLNNFFEIKYEILLASPKLSMLNVFNFCGMNWPENKKFDYEFAKIGKIRHKNNYGNFDVIQEITKETLTQLGY
ncbi:MAG: hypothetical protein A4S09_13900 [Proteobacteria bacterium SG_bin7]|nr:MAG: hypothetical protein A4S09_13900 [Proteobacteria bacterium SG_bin7]